MKKFLLSLSIFALTAVVVPTTAVAAIDIVEVNNSVENPVEFQGKSLIVEKCQNQTLCIYDVTGKPVRTIKITNTSQRIDLSELPKGCYIVKIGTVVRKISIQ